MSVCVLLPEVEYCSEFILVFRTLWNTQHWDGLGRGHWFPPSRPRISVDLGKQGFSECLWTPRLAVVVPLVLINEWDSMIDFAQWW